MKLKSLFPIILCGLIFFTVGQTAMVNIHNNFRNTSSLSCFPYWSSHACFHEMIQKIHKAKHFILIQQPNVIDGKDGEDTYNALVDAQKRNISIKFISDKDLKLYDFPPFNDETRLWIDTKPDSYVETADF